MVVRKRNFNVMLIFIIAIFNGMVLNARSVSDETLSILESCAERNTKGLEGGISEENIIRFKEYCSKTFGKSRQLALVLVSFTPFDEAGAKGGWNAESITAQHEWKRVKTLLQWLEKNYTPAKKMKFFYLSSEPYFTSWGMSKNIKKNIEDLLKGCPLLISCNHPDLGWTYKSVLIPDDLILQNSFNERMENLFTAPVHSSNDDLLSSGQKGFIPFSQRKSCVYFRGGLSVSKLPFNIENMKRSPRFYLLMHINEFPYVDFGITRICLANNKYRDYVMNSFGHFKCKPVDFFEHAQHKYLLSCDGYGSAWSRVELVMATGSLLFLNAQCRQYFYDFMQDGKTHVEIDKYFSNLNDAFMKLENDPILAEKIGKQGQEFAQRFFTKEAIDAYLWLVLNKLENYTING